MKKIKDYQKMLVKNMAYSRMSFNHAQQKTDILTIAVIRKRRWWTANMAVAYIVSSSEHFCLLFSTSFFFFFFFFFTQGHFKHHFVPTNIVLITQTGLYLANEVSIRKWASTRYIFCQHRHLGSVHGYSETRSRSDYERSIRTIKDS